MFKFRYHQIWILSTAVLVFLCLSQNVLAVNLSVHVRSKSGKPVSQAVVYASPLSGTYKPASEPGKYTIDQKDKEFIPFINVVQTGTSIYFPNSDQIQHHVYSFSRAKKFDIPLYEGMPPNPVAFDKEGVVVLGCNIHDWMLDYIYVVETPYFTKTDKEGNAFIELFHGPGEYDVRVWHPELRGSAKSTSQRIRLDTGGDIPFQMNAEFVIKQKKIIRVRRGPTSSGFGKGGYR
jgi:hypothetical protein